MKTSALFNEILRRSPAGTEFIKSEGDMFLVIRPGQPAMIVPFEVDEGELAEITRSFPSLRRRAAA